MMNLTSDLLKMADKEEFEVMAEDIRNNEIDPTIECNVSAEQFKNGNAVLAIEEHGEIKIYNKLGNDDYELFYNPELTQKLKTRFE